MRPLKNPKALRVAVEGGGCSGFQYLIELGQPKDDDLILEKSGEKVLIDSVSPTIFDKRYYRL